MHAAHTPAGTPITVSILKQTREYRFLSQIKVLELAKKIKNESLNVSIVLIVPRVRQALMAADLAYRLLKL
jgi:hypothetical protein